MRFTPFVTAFLMALSATNTFAAPIEEVVTGVQGITIGTPSLSTIPKYFTNSSDEASVEKRDYCGWPYQYDRSDGSNLVGWLQSSSGWVRLYPGWNSWYSWGSAKVCVYNWDSWQTTDVSAWEAGWGVSWIGSQCCNEPYIITLAHPSCPQGEGTGHGSNGLPVNIVAMNSGNSC